jgi:uncharacterized membrane protein
MPETPRKATTINSLFEIAVVGKAVDGLLEIIGGLLLFLVSPEQLNWILRAVTQHELSNDPHDVLANLLVHSVQHVSVGTWNFAAVFLLWHGAVKVGLVAALLLKLRWAYPLAIVAFSLFLVYQVYRYLHTYSVWLLVLSLLDLFVIVVIWFEYNRSSDFT